MAEDVKDIVIIEENDVKDIESSDEKQDTKDDASNLKDKKKLFIIIGAVSIVIIILIIIIVLVVKKSKKESTISTFGNIEKKLKEDKVKPIQPSKLENMIAKANYLYQNGSKDKALSLYEKIAVYSEAISLYNLGVAQLKNKQYKTALSTFQKAIRNDEKRCVSAINAAVCSLHLQKQDDFKYYIDLAYAYLPNEVDSPLYSYYFTLINYYNQNYFEALSSLKHPTTQVYPEVQKHLKAKIEALIDNNYDAIDTMETNLYNKDLFSLGLLYARVGDITLAQKYLEDAIMQNIEPMKANLALAFINIKAGKCQTASTTIKKTTDKYGDAVYKPYPIKVELKDSLFNPTTAQQNYRDRLEKSNFIVYQKIFYFSPYKIFNANNTISYIRKGNANIYIDNIKSAKNYLQKGLSSSNANIGIAKAIKKALSFQIRSANKDLLKMEKVQPKHSILQYDIGLTFAQMGDMKQAYKHFIRSYHLDAKNYLAGVYAVMSANLINKDVTTLKSIIKDTLSNEKDSEEKELCKTLLYIVDNNYLGAIEWLDNSFKQRPLYLAMDIIISLRLNRDDIAKKSAQKLTIMLPHDILPHLLYIDANFSHLKTKEYAEKVLNYLKVQKFYFNDLYYGPFITRYLYIQQNLNIGKLYFLKKRLSKKIDTSKGNKIDLISSLALTTLYDQEFEQSYVLYNQLIDELKMRDAQTLFLGAVASTAAGHHENAIALLELANLKNRHYPESRYALGLLYLQVQNNKGAIIQLGRIGDTGFKSEYFNFNIDLDKLSFEKQETKK